MSWSRLRFALTACLSIGAPFTMGAPLSPAYAGPLAAGFDALDVRHWIGREQAFGTCPETPTPVTDMGHYLSMYDPKDPTQSHIDREREALMKTRDDDFMAFSNLLDQLANKALIATPPNKAIEDCIFHQIAAWAKAGAALDHVADNDRLGHRQAIMMQAWNGAVYANALLQSGALAGNPGPDAEAIRAWLRRLALSIEDEFSGFGPFVRHNHNHAYWAGYAVASIAVVLDDRALFAFGRDALRQGLDSVAADGSLPAEMDRGERAFMYQQFATLPLAGLVILSDRNGYPLNPSEEAALERLVSFDARGIVSLDEVQKITGVKPIPAAHSFDLAWIDMLLPYFHRHNPSLAAAIEPLAAKPGIRPSYFVYLGGNVTAAYNPGALAK